jgi:hypothetical protein
MQEALTTPATRTRCARTSTVFRVALGMSATTGLARSPSLPLHRISGSRLFTSH